MHLVLPLYIPGNCDPYVRNKIFSGNNVELLGIQVESRFGDVVCGNDKSAKTGSPDPWNY